jgi:hypothetical protein
MKSIIRWAIVCLAATLMYAAPAFAQLPTYGIMINRDRLANADTLHVVAYAAPQKYVQWWDEIAHCTGLEFPPFNPLQGIPTGPTAHDWMYVAADVDAFMVDGEGPFIGYTFVKHAQIWVLAKYAASARLVKHEMIHALMYGHGMRAGHPARYFDKCEVAS